MAKIVVGAATSHAFAFRDPSFWDAGRQNLRQSYLRRTGNQPPPELQQVNTETDEDLRRRYESIRRAHDTVRDRFAALNLDALILLGDDQNELFTESTYLPAFAIYTGEEAFQTPVTERQPDPNHRVPAGLGKHLYASAVDAGFDLTAIGGFPDGVLKSHAFGPVLQRLTPKSDIPVVPIFVEAIHVPAPSPRRCYELGRALAASVETWTGGERVAVCASGGISHYTASFPYRLVPGAVLGDIHVDFDRQLMRHIERGEAESWVSLSNDDLLEHGDHELHAWMTLLGMVGTTKAEVLAYEPFFRAIMGMGVAYWDTEAALVGSA